MTNEPESDTENENQPTMGDWPNGPDELPEVPETDAFGQETTANNNVRPVGAGAKSQCRRCGSRHGIALYGGTDPTDTSNWEEYYICECGATGTYRVNHDQGKKTFLGAIDFPRNVEMSGAGRSLRV